MWAVLWCRNECSRECWFVYEALPLFLSSEGGGVEWIVWHVVVCDHWQFRIQSVPKSHRSLRFCWFCGAAKVDIQRAEEWITNKNRSQSFHNDKIKTKTPIMIVSMRILYHSHSHPFLLRLFTWWVMAIVFCSWDCTLSMAPLLRTSFPPAAVVAVTWMRPWSGWVMMMVNQWQSSRQRQIVRDAGSHCWDCFIFFVFLYRWKGYVSRLSPVYLPSREPTAVEGAEGRSPIAGMASASFSPPPRWIGRDGCGEETMSWWQWHYELWQDEVDGVSRNVACGSRIVCYRLAQCSRLVFGRMVGCLSHI